MPTTNIHSFDIPRELIATEVLPPLPGIPAGDLKAATSHGKYDVRQIGTRGVGKGVNFYSLAKEQAIGRSLAEQVEANAKLVADPVVTEYVNRLGQNLVRNSDAQVPFTIKVIDSDEINAFALPGGYFYVNSGLIVAAESEAELAGVMAHEIAHVAARHATKNATRAEIFNLASIGLIFLGGPVGYAVQSAVQVAVPLTFLKFSRNMEREADLLGIQYGYASGYDPSALVDFFERLEAKKHEKHSALAKAFASHPMTGDRIKAAEKEIATMLPAKNEYLVDTSDFQEVKTRLLALSQRNRMRIDDEGPKLRKRADSGTDSAESEERPTLKRK